MTTHPRPGRVNHEPNSWPTAIAGPLEDPATGFASYPEESAGTKRRLRPESFLDHYSQARQFYFSQTLAERKHIADAFVFELSKVDEGFVELAHAKSVTAFLARCGELRYWSREATFG